MFLKLTARILDIMWCCILLLLASGFIVRKLTFLPDNPNSFADYSMAALMIGLAVLVFFKYRFGFWASAVLFALCAICDGWGLLIKHDARCWPGALAAAFGILYIAVKTLERRRAKA